MYLLNDRRSNKLKEASRNPKTQDSCNFLTLNQGRKTEGVPVNLGSSGNRSETPRPRTPPVVDPSQYSLPSRDDPLSCCAYSLTHTVVVPCESSLYEFNVVPSNSSRHFLLKDRRSEWLKTWTTLDIARRQSDGNLFLVGKNVRLIGLPKG